MSGFIPEDIAKAAVEPLFQRNAIMMHVSREMALDYGLVEPTPEEAAERAASRQRWHEREVAAWLVFDAMVPALDVLTDPASRAVLDLHARADWIASSPLGEMAGQCAVCYDGSDMGDREEWPCETVKTIAAVHGIESPDINLWRRAP